MNKFIGGEQVARYWSKYWLILVTHKMIAKGDKVRPLEQAVEGLRLIQQPRSKGGHQ